MALDGFISNKKASELFNLSIRQVSLFTLLNNVEYHKFFHKFLFRGEDMSNNIFWAMILNVIIALAQIIAGIFSGSLALISDALHNINDFFSLFISYIANKIASNKKSDIKHSYGFKRVEIISAFINGIMLLGVFFYLLFEAYKRLRTPHEVLGVPTLIVAIIGLIGNILGAMLLHEESHENLNIKSAFLHLVSDSLSSVGVILSSILILWKNLYIADTIISIVIAIFVLFGSYELLKESIHILLEGVPYNLDIEDVKRKILEIEGVKDVHHIHLWQIGSKEILLSAHVVVKDQELSEAEKIYGRINSILRENLGIIHSTIQLETSENKGCNCEF